MAVSEETKKQYLPSIGIETHVQLNTKTKLFSAVGNDARGAAPNSLVSHIDTGMPGALPVLNQAAIEQCVKAAVALNTQPQKISRFERKHYFYPDSPKGYQITQYEAPIIKGGYLNVPFPEGEFRVEIERANLEEDAGKNTHPEGADYSLVDLNRAGTPLLEIVSRPDIHSPVQAKAFAREMWLTMKYSGVTDGDLYLGQVRFDINISVSKESDKLGTRSEIKNLNSFRAVENAAAYEIDRQIELLEKGRKIDQETRGWDEAKQKSTSQRGKEEAQDYRYMPEPDIPPVELEDEFAEKIKDEVPTLPAAWRQSIGDLGIQSASVEALLERNKEYGLDYLSRIKEAMIENRELASFIAKYLVNDYFKLTDEIKRRTEYAQPAVVYLPTIKQFSDVYKMLSESKLNSTSASVLLYNSWTQEPDADMAEYAREKNMLQVSDESEIEKIVSEVLAQNVKAAEDVKKGEMKAIGFLVGQVMAKSQGKANPQLAQDIIKKHLGL